MVKCKGVNLEENYNIQALISTTHLPYFFGFFFQFYQGLDHSLRLSMAFIKMIGNTYLGSWRTRVIMVICLIIMILVIYMQPPITVKVNNKPQQTKESYRLTIFNSDTQRALQDNIEDDIQQLHPDKTIEGYLDLLRGSQDILRKLLEITVLRLKAEFSGEPISKALIHR